MKKHLVIISDDLNKKLQSIKKSLKLQNVNEAFVIMIQKEYDNLRGIIK